MEPLAEGLQFQGQLIAASAREAFAVDTNGSLRAIGLRRRRGPVLEIGPGRVIDLLYLGGQRMAVLAGNASGKDESSGGKLIIMDRKRSRSETIEPIAPAGLKWNAGRIIGRHDAATAYFFLHLFYQTRQYAPFRGRDVGESCSPIHHPGGFQDRLQKGIPILCHQVALLVVTVTQVTAGYQHAIYAFLQGHQDMHWVHPSQARNLYDPNVGLFLNPGNVSSIKFGV